MYEVKVYDSSGNLKKVISAETLSKRPFWNIMAAPAYNNARTKPKEKDKPEKVSKKVKK